MATPTQLTGSDFHGFVSMADAKNAQNYPHDVYIQSKSNDATKVDKNLQSREQRRIETSLLEAVNTNNADPILRQIIALIQSYPTRAVWTPMVMATDGFKTFFNPFVTQTLSNSEVLAVLIHECGHQLYGDIVGTMTMRENYQHIFWRDTTEMHTPAWAEWLKNIFIDPIVDRLALECMSTLIDKQFLQDHIQRMYILMDAVLKPAVDAGFSTGDIKLDSMVTNNLWDTLYDSFENKTGNSTDTDKWVVLHKLALLMSRAYDMAPPNADGGIGGVAPSGKASKAAVKAKQESAVTNACKQAGVGTDKYGLDIPEPEPSNQIQDHLPEIISNLYEAIGYSYSAIDVVNAQNDIIFPEKIEPPGMVCVLLDVSGSVVYDKQAFPVLLGELSAALSDPRIESILVVPYDYGEPKEEDVRELAPGDDIVAELADIAGAGGTSFTDAFKYAEEHELAPFFSCIINLTDGWASFDPDPDWTIPRVWLSTDRATHDLDESSNSVHVLLPNRKHEVTGDTDDDDV